MKTTKWIAAALLAGSTLIGTQQAAHAGTDPWIGEIMTVAFTYCPNGWLPANGQTLSISQNSALFSLLGTNFGGNGTQTFGLPNLQGRTVLGAGTGQGLPPVQIGEMAGSPTTTLSIAQMPAHTHPATTMVRGSENPPSAPEPAGLVLGASNIYTAGPADSALDASTATTTVGIAGNNLPVDIRNPYVGMLVCIATQGAYPPRP